MRVAQLEKDGFKDQLRMLQHVAIPEADHPPTSSFQIRGSAAIRLLFRNVLPSVELDHERVLYACEIREVLGDRMLTPEAVPRQPSVANMKPPSKFCVGHGPSQRPCTIAGPHTPMLTRTAMSCDWTRG